jgi:hypothetical protein
MNARYGLAIQVSSSCAVKLMQPGPGGVRLAARFDAPHHTACLTLTSRVRITDFCSLVSVLDAFGRQRGMESGEPGPNFDLRMRHREPD